MRANPRRWLPTAYRFVLVCALALALGAPAALAQADATSADLCGFVRDPAGAVVAGATVTARNPSVGVTRTATHQRRGLLPASSSSRRAQYEVTVEAANFKKAVVPSVTLTVGQRADLDFALEIGQITDVVTVTGAQTELIETSKTNVSNTVDQVRIENLPINQRDYINFTLTTSTVTRDNGRPIGPAPTSGLELRRPARPLEPRAGGRRRQHRQLRQRLALDRLAGGGAGVPGRHQLLRARVRPLGGRRRQRRHQVGHATRCTATSSASSATSRFRRKQPVRAHHRRRPRQEAAVHARAVRRHARLPARPRQDVRLRRLRAAQAAGVGLLHLGRDSAPDFERHRRRALPPLLADLHAHHLAAGRLRAGAARAGRDAHRDGHARQHRARVRPSPAPPCSTRRSPRRAARRA